jgi:hypothetical protein
MSIVGGVDADGLVVIIILIQNMEVESYMFCHSQK